MENDTLHSLILSLTPVEKSDFKKYIRYNSGKRIPDYEELYDIYNKLSRLHVTKEERLIKLERYIKKKPSIQNNLPNIRMRLKERLLQSLVMAQAGKNSKQMVQNLISEVEVLIDRKMYSETNLNLKIKQAKKYAIIYDLNNLITEIIDLEILLLGKKSTRDDDVLLEKLIEEQSQYRKLYDVEIKLKNIFCKITLNAERDIQITQESSKTALVSVINNLTLTNNEIKLYKKENNIHIVTWYYRIKNLFYRSIGEYEKAIKNSKALITYFESDEKRINTFEIEYVKALCSYTRTCFHHYKTKALVKSIEKVQRIYNKKKNFSALEATCDMGILCYLRTYEYEKAIEISTLMDGIWKELTLKIEDGKLLWYAHTNVLLHWVCNNTIAFNNWINRGLSFARSNKGRAFYFGLRMLDLMTDLDNDQLFAFKEKLEAFQKTLQ